MVTVKEIQLACDESLHLELEELGHLIQDFINKEVLQDRQNAVYPVDVVRAMANASGALMQAAFSVYLYYSSKNRQELAEDISETKSE